MTYDPQKYWPDRYRKQGVHYVARGGRADNAREQAAAITPFLQANVSGTDVLDFGCGPQRFRSVLEADGRTYTGVDLIPGLGTVPLGNELPAESFDTICAIWVLQHIVDEAAYTHWVTQLWRALRPGGRLVVVDHVPRTGMAAHMQPRGIGALLPAGRWSDAQVVGTYDDHWMGWLQRAADGDDSEPDVERLTRAVVAPVAFSTTVEKHQPGTGPDALVIGGGECVWRDVEALETLLGSTWNGIVIAANDVGCHWPRTLHHWATLHPEKMPGWRESRHALGHPGGYITWARRSKMVDRLVQPWGGGASGLLAVRVAAELGCARVVLCGVGMQRTPHFAESAVHQAGKPWASADAHWRPWQQAHREGKLSNVRSMSGRTLDLLGAPTLEWLRS